MSKSLASKSPKTGVQKSEVLSRGTPPLWSPPRPKTRQITFPEPGATNSWPLQKRLKISVFSVSFFDQFRNSKWTPTWSKIEPQRLPSRSWSQVVAGSWFRSHFGIFVEPPGTSKIVLSLWRGATFRTNCLWRPGAQHRPQNEPKIKPKSTPRGFHKA